MPRPKVRYVPASLPRNDGTNGELAPLSGHFVGQECVEGAKVSDLVPLAARRHPLRLGTERERAESGAVPAATSAVQSHNVTAVGRDQFVVVATRVGDILERNERLPREEKVHCELRSTGS